jgi:hypothetical protein
MTARVTLPEPVEIAKFWKSRQRTTAIVVSLRSYEGHNLIDLRENYTNTAGQMRPSTRGLCLVVKRLPELSRALQKAMEKARALGLIDDEGAGT